MWCLARLSAVAPLAEASGVAGVARAWFGLPLSVESLVAGPGDQAVAIVDSTHSAQLEILEQRAASVAVQ